MEQSDDEWFDAVINVMKISDIFDGIVEAEEALKNASRKRIYESHHRTKDLWSTPWGAMLLNMEVSTELSFERRKFRRRFRVPYEMFVEIVRECDDGDIFGVYQRRRKIPTEFKVLASLRILGRDICCDEIEERLNISESHTNLFFKQLYTRE